jgi:hypothetical protein
MRIGKCPQCGIILRKKNSSETTSYNYIECIICNAAYCTKCAKAKLCPEHFNKLSTFDQQYFIELNNRFKKLIFVGDFIAIFMAIILIIVFIYNPLFFLLLLPIVVGFMIFINIFPEFLYKRKILACFPDERYLKKRFF